MENACLTNENEATSRTSLDENGRDVYLDNVKGILIFFVVLGHYIEPFRFNLGGVVITNVAVYLYQWIYSFHMPMFAIVLDADEEMSFYAVRKEFSNRAYRSRYPVTFYAKIFVFCRDTQLWLFHYCSAVLCSLPFLFKRMDCDLLQKTDKSDREYIYKKQGRRDEQGLKENQKSIAFELHPKS